MIESSFDIRTQANMDVALEHVCKKTPRGEHHETRALVADAIVRCAKRGMISLGALTRAGNVHWPTIERDFGSRLKRLKAHLPVKALPDRWRRLGWPAIGFHLYLGCGAIGLADGLLRHLAGTLSTYLRPDDPAAEDNLSGFGGHGHYSGLGAAVQCH